MNDWEKPILDREPPVYEPSYLRTDEFEDVLQNLHFLSSILANVSEEPARWKWVVLAMHNTVQGACVCYLSGTAGVGALKKDAIRKTLEYYDGKKLEFPKQELAPLSQLLLRLPDGLRVSINEITAPYPFDLPGDLKRLQEMRDQFTHFAPTSWSIELDGLPRLIQHCLGLVEKIVNRSDFQIYNRFKELPVQDAIDKISNELGAFEQFQIRRVSKPKP